MKRTFLCLFVIALACSCNGQSSAVEQAKKVQKAIKEAPRPGTMPTKAGEWTMTAKINGKAWSASSIMPPAAAGRIIGYYKDDYIALPGPEKRYAKAGKKYALGDSYSADIIINDGFNYNLGIGTMELTSVNGDWAEGNFSFTITSTDGKSTVKITDGFFRVKL